LSLRRSTRFSPRFRRNLSVLKAYCASQFLRRTGVPPVFQRYLEELGVVCPAWVMRLVEGCARHRPDHWASFYAWPPSKARGRGSSETEQRRRGLFRFMIDGRPPKKRARKSCPASIGRSAANPGRRRRLYPLRQTQVPRRGAGEHRKTSKPVVEAADRGVNTAPWNPKTSECSSPCPLLEV
jgi:hypothetical protein